jgi:chromosome segregation ATPase
MTTEECNIAIRDWLEEISEELEFLNKRRTEVEKEREDFLKRIGAREKNYLLFVS